MSETAARGGGFRTYLLFVSSWLCYACSNPSSTFKSLVLRILCALSVFNPPWEGLFAGSQHDREIRPD